ncbi:MAG: FAD-dependent oxidoreductase [Actinomycetota bacterium]|nr:FAD-dependent oxidoreductase [Actinomycetota bacterium]
MTARLVVIGGDAAGMSAASTAKRGAGDDLEVVVVERDGWTSYSACGIPYWVAGDVDGPDGLVARTPEAHRERGIDVRTGTTAAAVDVAARTVTVRPTGAAVSDELAYDHLVIATGAAPIRPDLPGIDADGVHGVQTLDDGCRLLATLADHEPRRAVVVGAGYIGVEMAEACLRRGLRTTIIDQAEEPMTLIDPDLGAKVREAMIGFGVDVVTGSSVERVETAGGRAAAVVADGKTYDADLVVLGLGVRPQSELALAAGLPLGGSGGIRVEPSTAVPGHEGVWAAGDCVESWDRVAESFVHVPLGTHANKQGRVAGLNIAGGHAVFRGIVGTAVTKVCELEIARTGLSSAQAEAAGHDVRSATVDTTTKTGYFPGAEPMTVRLTAEPGGRLLGAQIVGGAGSALRIDTCATALWAGMSVQDLVDLDLAYAPPFSSTWDPVQVAARALLSELH